MNKHWGGWSGSLTAFPSRLLWLFSLEGKHMIINPTSRMVITKAHMLNEKPHHNRLSCIFECYWLLCMSPRAEIQHCKQLLAIIKRKQASYSKYYSLIWGQDLHLEMINSSFSDSHFSDLTANFSFQRSLLQCMNFQSQTVILHLIRLFSWPPLNLSRNSFLHIKRWILKCVLTP